MPPCIRIAQMAFSNTRGWRRHALHAYIKNDFSIRWEIPADMYARVPGARSRGQEVLTMFYGR